MKGVNQDIISEVRNRARILEIISELVVLKRSGKDYKGLCPFHNEKSPSFFVNPEKGIFKCFGCGEGGDVFAFIQKTKRLDFIDAVRELAQRTGVQLIETGRDQVEYDRKSTIFLLYEQAAQYYHHLLKDPKEGLIARTYLEKRGLNEEYIERFKLGYAPNNWDGLLNYLTQANHIAPETLAEAGLVRKKADSTNFYDLFRGRLMIPIQDEQGRVLAFGGRTLGDDQVKYLNSPESPIYIKGEHLFALCQAKEAIREKDEVIVVEGYFDAITAHLHGFNNTVATLGTALTERQGKLLVRFTESKRVYLCFDSDEAGIRAVERGTETLSSVAEGIGIDMRIISVPGCKDPDECLRSNEKESSEEESGDIIFAQAIKNAPKLLDYRLERAVANISIKTASGRIESARLIVPILADIKNAVARGEYVRQWAARIGIKEEDLLTDVSQYRRQNNSHNFNQNYRKTGFNETSRQNINSVTNKSKNIPKLGSSEAELSLLALYMQSKEDFVLMKEKFYSEEFLDPIYQRIKMAIESIDKYVTHDDFWQKIQDKLSPDLESSQRLWDLASKADEIRKQNLPIRVILNDYESSIFNEKLSKEINTTRKQMKQNPSEEEETKLSSKVLELIKLQGKLQRAPEALPEVKRQFNALLVETN